MRKTLFQLLSTIILLSGTHLSISAETFLWIGTSGNWSDPQNWQSSITGSIPGKEDDVVIHSTGTEIIIDGGVYCKSLTTAFPSSNGYYLNTSSSNGIKIAGAGTIHVFGNIELNAPVNETGELKWQLTSNAATTRIRSNGHVFSNSMTITTESDVTIEDHLYVNGNLKVQSGVLQAQATSLIVASQIEGLDKIQGGQVLRVGDPANPLSHTVTAIVVPNSCNGQCNATATAVVVGGSGNFSYQWSTVPPQTTATATGLCAGTYLVVVTDLVGGGQVPAFAIVVDPPPLIIFFSNAPALCNGNCNGSSSASAAGGTPGYTFLWAPGNQTTSSITNQCAGTYTLTVTDNNGCVVTQQSTITQPVVLIDNGSSTNVTCNAACNGTAAVAPGGGTGPYSFLWAPGGQTTSSVTNLCPGTYTCTITDANGCLDTYVTTITQPPVLTVQTAVTNATCFGLCNGASTATPAGGVAPYTFLWQPGGQTTAGITGQCAGTYTVTVTDNNGCSIQQAVNITQPPALISTPTAVNITCFGSCNGTTAANASGGTPGYTYSWAPSGGNAATATSLCPGVYTVTITDNNGCTTTGQVSVTEPAQLLTGSTQTNVTCFNACDGTATANPTGGTGPYTYNWLPGNITSPGISNLCPGTYTLTVTDANSCTAQTTITITQPPQLVVNGSGTNILCNGICNGTATATPNGGTGPYTYVWAPGGQTTPSISGLCAGQYTVTVTDANGCQRNQTITITQPNVLSVSTTATQLLCTNACSATISANVSGGTAAYTYSWSPGNQTTPSITNQCAGTYTVNITDANGCTSNSVISITQPTPFQIIVTETDASCNGSCDGSIQVVVNGSTAPYTYSWAPTGQTTPNISGLCAGTYSITVTDANGCDTTIAINITQPQPISAGVTTVAATCSGNCDGSATANPSGGIAPYTFLWMPGGQTTPSVTGLCAGAYTLTVTDANGCVRNQTVSITQPQPLSAQITGSTASCNICNGTATVAVSGGNSPYAYFWTPAGGTNPTATNLCVGSYTCTITDARGCTTTATVSINQLVNISITSSSSTPTCFGDCDAVASANASGGTNPYTYVWQPGNILNQNLTNACAGSYTVTATDVNGCFSSTTITFGNPPQITATSNSTNASCHAVCDGTASVSASGGTGVLSYLWAPGGQTTPAVTGLCAGSYTCTVTDQNGCDTTIVFNITEPTLILANAVVSDANCTLCDGGIVTSVSGGVGPYTYLWAPGGQTTPNISSLCPGIYTVTVTDASGCSENIPIAVGNINGPTATMAFANASCQGICDGTATTTVTGGTGPFTFDWTPGTPTGDGTPSVSGLCAGIYFVQITDAIGCITFQNVTITEPNILSAPATLQVPSCNAICDGSITVTPTGGTAPYTFSWSSGGNGPTESGLCAGNYSVDITDANGCTGTFTFTLTQPGTIGLAVTSTNITCNSFCDGSATATVTGGTTPYSYVWSSGPIVPSAVNLCPGTYTVTVTDASGCSVIDSVTITQPPPILVNLTSTNASCNGDCDGTAAVVASGGIPGYTYLWSPGGQTTASVNGLCAGAYSISTTDAAGCENIQSVTITEPPAIVANSASTSTTCFGDCDATSSLTVTGGTPTYTYSWAPGGQTTPVVTGLCAGVYTVTITDANGCDIQINSTITQPAQLLANTSFTSPSCGNTCDGSATANPIGGTGPYTFLWAPGGQTTATIINQCAGTYTVTVRDSRGCIDIQTVTILPAQNLSLSVASAPANCSLCNGTINVIPSGGTAPYTYAWSGGLPPQPNQTNVCAGLYTVLVTDASGCQSTFTVTLNNNGGPTGETITSADATCPNTCDGSASVLPIGGTAPYTYLWIPGGQTVNSLTNMCAGSYNLEVTDANGCIRYSPVIINGPQPINGNQFVTNANCVNSCDGAINLNPSGGTGPYSFLWSPNGQTTSTISGQCVGTYTCAITDVNGCTQQVITTINAWNNITTSVSSTPASCNGNCDGTLTVNVTGGTAPFVFQWNDPLGQNGVTASGLCAGSYSVIITDAQGCAATATGNVTTPNSIIPNAIVNNTTCGQCDGSISLNPTGGVGPYSYLWSTNSTTSSLNALCNGVYSVLITDATGCSQQFNVIINSNGGPSASNANITNASCASSCDGSISLNPSGGTAPYTFNWLPAGQTTASINGQCVGAYTVQITDATGCIFIDTFSITAPNALQLNQQITNTDCGFCSGTIALNVTGGNGPYTYNWQPGNLTTSTITNLCAGLYTVTVTDAFGCSLTQAIPVSNINSTIVLNTSSTSISCNSSCDGTATANIVSGNGPFTYTWSNGATTSTTTGLCAGTYIVQVTDVTGCVSSGIVTLTQPAPLSNSNLFVQGELCANSCDGFISANISGGTLPYTYSWSNLQTGSIATGLCAGSYTVTVTDANGCTATQNATIISPVVLGLSNSAVTDASCNNVADGAIDVSVTGGTTPYTYSWSGPNGYSSTTEDPIGLFFGSYTLIATDANGCIITSTFVVSPSITLNANAGSDTSLCASGSLVLDASASANATTFAWFILPTNTQIGNQSSVNISVPLGTTSYVVVVTNGGCTDADTVQVGSLPGPTADAGADQTIITGMTTTIGGSPTGPSGSTYVWGPTVGLGDPSSANPVASPAGTTTYVVQVTDTAGCSSTDTVVVSVVPMIDFPNGFTPNGDGVNDYWQIDNIQLFENCEVEVFNRWGERLFYSRGYVTPFDGRFNGEPLPVGTYYYIIKLNDPLFPDTYTGPITILR
jgi:gliding motility-associated-like protein